tara:strand:- start:280 stop:531 length:252 start_codon:yes stop_codon:yes gene_type:complete
MMKNTGFLKQLMDNCSTMLELRDDLRAEYEQIECALATVDRLMDDLEDSISESIRIIEDVEAENIRRDVAWSQKPETQEKEGV